jgi:site-specific recombinase, resolvase family protein
LILSAVKRFSKFVLNDEKAFALELQSLWKDKQEEKPKYNQSEFCLIDGSFLFRQVFKQS